MKMRNGFISNSSSSSFIVAFDTKPKTVEETKKILFGDMKSHSGYTTTEIAETIFREIQQQDATQIDLPPEVIFAMECGADVETVLEKKWSELKWGTDEYDKIYEGLASYEKLAAFPSFAKEHKDKYLLITEYGDNDGSYFSMMEHSGVFAKLPHERVSKH